MIVAEGADVQFIIPHLRTIRGRASMTMCDIFTRVQMADTTHLTGARAASHDMYGFVLFVPEISSLGAVYGLTAYVEERYRRCGFGSVLIDAALEGISDRTVLSHLVWRGSEDAYQFWRAVGVLPGASE